jgi:3-methyladenine DNA glycosylase AlkD
MNGVVSDQMKTAGIEYKKNYGVTIPVIRDIAKTYAADADLANRLWMLGIRETMILATLLYPTDKLTLENAKKYILELDKMELVEQMSMNLLNKLPYANSLCIWCVNSPELWVRITGLMLSVRIYENLNQAETSIIIDKSFEFSQTNEYYLYKAIALSLSRICRKNKETAQTILDRMNNEFDTNNTGQQYISNELKAEIEFLEVK